MTEIGDRFAGRLEFGTAGLRGRLGGRPEPDEPGRRAARGGRVRVVPAANAAPGASAVVVGFDARHKSDVFARDTAGSCWSPAARHLVLPRPLPTPVLAFAIRHLGCGRPAVVVTASHNPPQDNGYKVYLGR